MKKLLLIFLFPWVMLSQEVLVEKTPPDYIKTIIFKADGNDKNQFPIVRRNESFSLQFDDLGGMRRLTTIKLPIAMPIGRLLL